MKRQHRIPPDYIRPADPIDARYQAEVDRATNSGAVRERAAQLRLESAERRLAKAERQRASRQQARAVLVARELVELRRQELLDVQRQMSSAPASTRHRSRGHKERPVPGMSTL